MNSTSEAKQVPSYDFGVLAVRTFGGACPEWARSLPPLTATPTIEIIIAREALDDVAASAWIVIAFRKSAPGVAVVSSDDD
jgi:hypothetical protein